jgi:hypothetical protein
MRKQIVGTILPSGPPLALIEDEDDSLTERAEELTDEALRQVSYSV